MLTNLAPNHLDRYRIAGGVLCRQGAAVPSREREVGLGDQRGRPGRARHGRAKRRRAGTCDSRSASAPTAGTTARRGRLMLGDRPLLPRDELPLLGDHNVANALAAALAAREAGADPAGSGRGVSGRFRAIPHRVEPVREVDGVLWINDSKSTNVTSTEVAVAALERPFVLLLGGRHKGAPYTPLIPLLGRAVPRRRRLRRGGAHRGGRPLARRCRSSVPVGTSGPCSPPRGGSRGPATRCCCPPRAPASTCSPTTRSAATGSAPPWRPCDDRGASHPAPRRHPLGDTAPRRRDAGARWSSASPRPTVRPVW